MSLNRLYTEKDNNELGDKIKNISSKIENTQEELNTAQSLMEIKNKEIYNDIKNIVTNNNPKPVKNTLYFTANKGLVTFNIDNTFFIPPPVILMSSKFDQRYLEFMESIIYTEKDSLDAEKVVTLLYLFNYIRNKRYPIVIKSGIYPKMTKKIASALNKYFNKNYSLLSSMYTMFNGLNAEGKESDKE